MKKKHEELVHIIRQQKQPISSTQLAKLLNVCLLYTSSFENYGSYMIIDDGIAIPHAKNEGTVRKTGMTLLVLHRPCLLYTSRCV